jgi:hypothetical protein
MWGQNPAENRLKDLNNFSTPPQLLPQNFKKRQRLWEYQTDGLN